MNAVESARAVVVTGNGAAVTRSPLADRLLILAENNRQKWADVADALSTSTTTTTTVSPIPVPCDEVPAQETLFTRNIRGIVSRSKTRMDTARGNNANVRVAHDDGVRDINIERNAFSTRLAESFAISVREVTNALNGIFSAETACIAEKGPEVNLLIIGSVADLAAFQARTLV